MRDVLVEVVLCVFIQQLALVSEADKDIATITVRVKLELGPLLRLLRGDGVSTLILSVFDFLVFFFKHGPGAVSLLPHIPQLHLVFLAELRGGLAEPVVLDH